MLLTPLPHSEVRKLAGELVECELIAISRPTRRQQLRSRSSATMHRYQLLPPLDGYFVDIPISNNPTPEFKQFMKWYTGGGAQCFAKDGYGLTLALELDIHESGFIYAKNHVIFFPPPNNYE